MEAILMKSINPATGELIKAYREHTPEEIRDIIEKAHDTFLSWREATFSERRSSMIKMAAKLREHKERQARLMTDEMGKPIAQSRAEIDKCARLCEYYADNAERMLQDESLESAASRSFIAFEPLGVILAVMPWNFPFWQVFRFAVPALMAGNVGLLKHASNVPGCALAIESVFRESGFPAHAFTTLLVGAPQVESIIRHDHVKAVTLTGSERAGSLVASQAGSEIKKTVLELGGSDPFIVLDDVDVESCAAQAVKGRMLNAGQSCIAAKRFIVLEGIADAFIDRCVALMKAQKIGDPHNEDIQVGPLARAEFVDVIDALVRDAVDKGARLLTGGRRREGAGFYYEATVLTGVTPEMQIFHEESFGPVAVIYPVRDDDEAVRVANATRFGLGASVWGRDRERTLKVARRLEAGVVFVNGVVTSDPRLPFGGVKKSGYGRELSHYGIREFTNIKTMWVG
jgi:succinate-semialdehyde dehydrogenase/glutarate-semialdehyde dehydrogenase